MVKKLKYTLLITMFVLPILGTGAFLYIRINHPGSQNLFKNLIANPIPEGINAKSLIGSGRCIGKFKASIWFKAPPETIQTLINNFLPNSQFPKLTEGLLPRPNYIERDGWSYKYVKHYQELSNKTKTLSPPEGIDIDASDDFYWFIFHFRGKTIELESILRVEIGGNWVQFWMNKTYKFWPDYEPVMESSHFDYAFTGKQIMQKYTSGGKFDEATFKQDLRALLKDIGPVGKAPPEAWGYVNFLAAHGLEDWEDLPKLIFDCRTNETEYRIDAGDEIKNQTATSYPFGGQIRKVIYSDLNLKIFYTFLRSY
ncbi:hypothetical protein ACFL54_08155 [Planctomycetota bacterium]